MGANLCKSKNVRREAEFFYKTVNVNELDNSAKEKVKLTISILRPAHGVHYQTSLLLYQSKAKTNYQLGGQTEDRTGAENTLTFNQFFVMEYYFEKTI